MAKRATWQDPRLAPIERRLARLIAWETAARNDPTLTALVRRAALTVRTAKRREPPLGKPRPLSGKPYNEPAEVELVLRAERWQRLWAYLAGEDVQPLGEFHPKETTLEFVVSWHLGLPGAKETRRSTRPRSSIDARMGQSTQFVLAVGRDAVEYKKRKQDFYRHIDAVFTKMERRAAESLRKAERVRLTDQAETLAAYLMYERLKTERSPKVWPIIARALWPAPYDALDRLKRDADRTRPATLRTKRDRLRRQIDGVEQQARRRVEAARLLVEAGWRRLFVTTPLALPPPNAND